MASNLILVAAIVTTGLVAGAFALYAHTIMPGLRRTDDRTFVGAFQSIDRAVINPWFATAYLGMHNLALVIVLPRHHVEPDRPQPPQRSRASR